MKLQYEFDMAMPIMFPVRLSPAQMRCIAYEHELRNARKEQKVRKENAE